MIKVKKSLEFKYLLNNFGDREHVERELHDNLSGKSLAAGESPRKKPKRQQRMTEVKRGLKNLRYIKNSECRLCTERTNLTDRNRVWEGRCNCRRSDGNIPPVIKAHVSCLEATGATMLECSDCGREFALHPMPMKQLRTESKSKSKSK